MCLLKQNRGSNVLPCNGFLDVFNRPLHPLALLIKQLTGKVQVTLHHPNPINMIGLLRMR